ncbi:hypothetical protein [Ekhidna sp.]
MKLTIKTLSLLLFFALSSSCKDSEPVIDSNPEAFQITLNPLTSVLNLNSGRTTSSGDSIVFTDQFFTLLDENCSEVDSEGGMIYDGQLKPIVLPNIEAGKYYYSLSVAGSNNIRYDSSASFTINSDTVLDAYVNNKQMRFKFIETSGFSEPTVEYVSYILNYSTSYRYDNFICLDSGVWETDNLDGYIDNSAYLSDLNTDFEYSDPIDLESVQVKFYESNQTLVKSYIIPIVRELKKHHSYSFEIDLSAIWSSEQAGSSVNIILEEIDWSEETIDLN